MLPAPPSLSIEEIASRLLPFGIPLAESQLLALQKYALLLLLWNQKVSLTSIEDPAEIVTRHFGEGIFALQSLNSNICRLADVGSGAGFPGIPLKIALPTLDVVLIEPNLKKCAFLTEIIGSLELRGIDVFLGQYSAFRQQPPENHSKVDVITSRALGDYKNLLQWAAHSLNPSGKVILWLGEEDAIQVSRTKRWLWEAPIRIPESRRRTILVGRPENTLI